MMTDPVADMLTRIRNALRERKAQVDVRRSKVNLGIARVLKDEGYIEDFRPLDTDAQGHLRIVLKYGPEGERVISELKRQSKPSRRIYHGVNDIPQVLHGLGIAILSTPRGILSDRECRREGVGGELLCTVS